MRLTPEQRHTIVSGALRGVAQVAGMALATSAAGGIVEDALGASTNILAAACGCGETLAPAAGGAGPAGLPLDEVARFLEDHQGHALPLTLTLEGPAAKPQSVTLKPGFAGALGAVAAGARASAAFRSLIGQGRLYEPPAGRKVRR